MLTKELLNEGVNLEFDVTKLEAEDIIKLLRVGYNDPDNEKAIREADGNLWFGYAGYSSSSHSHMYDYAWFDNDTDEKWYIVRLHIYIGKSGKLECEFSGMPIHHFEDTDDAAVEITKYFKRLKVSVGK